jgi:hypothetical protein
MDQGKPPQQGRKRGIPPPPRMRSVFSVLEFEADPFSLALWQALRNVLIWAPEPAPRTLFRPIPPHARARYEAARAYAPDLRSALDVLERLQATPDVADAREVATACHRVYQWADTRALLTLAAHFAEGAAYADPMFPTWAIDAGWICRRIGGPEMMERSGAWYRRAIALSVRTRNNAEILRALTGYGALKKDEGKLERARQLYEQSARRAVRTGRRRRAGVAYHYLFSLAVEAGWTAEALKYADQALTYYPIHDSRIPALLHDFAYLMIRLRYYQLALRVLERVAHCFEEPHDVGLMFATAAEAAGGARRPDRYQALEKAALKLLAVTRECAPAMMESLAEGARSLGDWERAERYAQEALALAQERGDALIEQSVTRLIEAVGRREPAAPCEDPLPDSQEVSLARRAATRIRIWRRRRSRLQSAAELPD